MCMFEKRLQILLDERRYDLLIRLSRERRTSVGGLVRDAIDRTYGVDLSRRRKAIEEILAAEPMELPDTVEELEKELEGIYDTRL